MSELTQIFLEEAERQVQVDSKTWTHKLKQKAWDTSRKQVKGAPKQLLTTAVKAIPVVGMILGPLVDKGFDYAKAKHADGKRVKYSRNINDANATSAELRKRAKHIAKTFKSLGDKIDGNMHKLNTATKNFEAAKIKFNHCRETDTMWNLAHALYKRRRYEYKFLGLTSTMKQAMSEVDAYLIASLAESTLIEGKIEEVFEDLEDELCPQKNKSKNGYDRIL